MAIAATAAPKKYGNSKYWKTVQVKAANVYVADVNVPVVMSGYGLAAVIAGSASGSDIVITNSAGTAVPCTLVTFSKSGSTMQMYYRDPAQSVTTGGTDLYVQWGGTGTGQVGNTIWTNCHGGTEDYFLVISGDTAGGKLVDISKNYTATDYDVLYDSIGKIGNAAAYNGTTSYSSFGNISQFDSDSDFVVSGWFTQRVINTTDILFREGQGSGAEIYCYSTGSENTALLTLDGGVSYSSFTYNTLVTANIPFYVVVAYNGRGIDNDAKIKIRINSAPVSLTQGGTTPAVTSNYTTFYISYPILSFDGKCDEFRCFSGALDSNQIKFQYDNQNGFATNATLTIGSAYSFENNSGSVYVKTPYKNDAYKSAAFYKRVYY